MTKIESSGVKCVEGAATALIGKLGLLLTQEYLLLSGVRGEVVHLRDDTAMMDALLRMLSETEDGAVDHTAREWMKQVRELSYDAEDCIDIFVRRISWASWVAGSCLGRAWHRTVTVCARHRLATDIKALRARAIALSERRARYAVDSQTLRPSIAFGSRIPPSSTPLLFGVASDDPSQFVGMGKQITSLSEKVDGQTDQSLKVFSIVGFGGVGKTTLAVEVCRRLEATFPYQAVVSVSQAFDPSKDLGGLLVRILKQLKKVKKDGKEEHSALGADINYDDVTGLAGNLKEHLAEKRYLIVIDDVWSISAWNAIRAMLPENKTSSRIIVTTRTQSVARECSSYSDGEENIHHAEPLNDRDSRSLFVRRVFEEKYCPKELEDAMGKILKICGGVPLAILSIASTLASYNSPRSLDMWTKICNSISSQLETYPTLEGMMQIITLSYNHLPHHLKACTMYLSIFPEDYMIYKPRLLRRWISEGLIQEKRGLTLLEVAESYYDELLSRNVIQPGVAIHGTVRHCHVHDVMLEVIVSKSLEANFVSLVGSPSGGTSSYDAVCRLVIHGDVGHDAEAMSMRHVRSLSSFCGKINEGPGKLLDRLTKFTLLRVLDLEDCKDLKNHHMKQICQLFLLIFLNLNETDITVIPRAISNLQHLQTLWLYDALLKGVPGSVINLRKLEHMSFKNREHPMIYLKLPQGLEQMESLQVLDRLELGKDDITIAKEIGKLVQLRVLGIVFPKDCNESVLTRLARSIDGICSLRELCIEEVPVREQPTVEANNMVFLHGLNSPPQLLRFLLIDGKIDRFPDWVKSLTHLIHIELRSIYLRSSQIYDDLCRLPSLLKITLGHGCCSDVQLVARRCSKFPVLKELAIIEDDGTQRDVQFEEGAMEKLEKLTMSFYNQKNLEGLNNLTSLKEVELLCRESSDSLKNAVRDLNNLNATCQESNKLKVIVKYE